MREYYDRRAREYEQIYRRDDPVRQAEQARIAEALRGALAGRRVLEIACGTGYWTSAIAETAEHVVATDASAEMLAIARAKAMPAGKVEFLRADAYALDAVAGTFGAAVAMCWLSHVPKDHMQAFLAQLHARLTPDAVVFLADNVFVPGMGGEFVSRPGCADTFKRRTLNDGSQHEILKNYYGEDELRALLRPWADNLQVRMGKCFWWVIYRVVHRQG
ncbi:MAG: class I SAM-dependent methyltransferase [Planctomycetota bacterium]|jgi:ubiquinone/menaquinone biosynthesis C-methylase UbiE